MPYKGQNEPKELVPQTENSSVATTQSQEAPVMKSFTQKPERKKLSQPVGNLSSNNIGIKATLEPPKRQNQEEVGLLEEKDEEYTIEELGQCWKEFAYQVKREKKDSLYSTLINADYSVNSEHLITLKIKNSVQSAELDKEKGLFLNYLRKNLKNTNIQLTYDLEEISSKPVMDSKATFDQLAEENTSLEKFRKLFNLDIEY